MISKALIILFLICLFCNPAYASKLLSEQGLDYYNEGVKAQRMGDLRNAQTNYQKAILLDAKYNKFILNNSGIIYANGGDIQKAELAFKEALRIDPDYHVPAFNLSLLYLRLAVYYKENGDTKEALKNLEQAFYCYPKKSYIIEEEKYIEEDKSEN